MRAFLAVIPPEEVVDELVSFLGPRRDALAPQGRWRWTRPEHLHLTLAFLPELEEWREEVLIEAASAWAERAAPLALSLAGAGAFPDPGSARVLWAAVAGSGGASLASWAKSLRAVASHAGARVDGTRFSPHLTLARSVGRPGPAGHLLQALDTLATSAWCAQEVHLVRSFLGQGPGGTPRYEVRHTWELTGPPGS
ncbi:RNA 2',3'-cyclic phosphodiesterase [Ornithinimicrobium flavum]|uniref:RNA 2',3'-cyclic phosphodiesterase n=1 Tax=Ornithinimicrobium flavum TaxID=1288636 RepID=UPI001070220E|nr:RNA 2',3'-cyclic phosphodiesterase [Ornithinimicrobium flavum]